MLLVLVRPHFWGNSIINSLQKSYVNDGIEKRSCLIYCRLGSPGSDGLRKRTLSPKAQSSCPALSQKTWPLSNNSWSPESSLTSTKRAHYFRYYLTTAHSTPIWSILQLVNSGTVITMVSFFFLLPYRTNRWKTKYWTVASLEPVLLMCQSLDCKMIL